MKVVIAGGNGSIGKKHAKNLKLLGVEFDIADPNLPTSFNYDLAIIATPTDTHVDILNFLDGKVPYIMVEKPLSNKPVKLKEYESQVFVNYPYRFERGLNCMKGVLDRGDLGRLQHATMENSYDYYKMHKNYDWVDYEGIILDDIHLINTSRYLFGEPVHIISGYARKEIAEWTWQARELIVSHSTDVLNQRYKKRVEVRGSEGTLIYNYRGHELWFAPKDESPRKSIAYKFADHLMESLKYVVNTVKENGTFNSLDDAVKDLEIVRQICEK